MKKINLELRIYQIPNEPIVVADYKCLSPECQTYHILGTLDVNLFRLSAVKKRWVEAMQFIFQDAVSAMAESIGMPKQTIHFTALRDMN